MDMCTNVSQLHQQGLRAPFGPHHVRAPGKYPHLPPPLSGPGRERVNPSAFALCPTQYVDGGSNTIILIT